MLKKFFIAIGCFILVVAVLGFVKFAQIKKLTSVSHVPPPSAVTTLEAKSIDWHSSLNAIGTLAPVEGVTVSADADGVIIKIGAESGTTVKAGDLLVEIDTTVEAAQLTSAEARAELARLQRERSNELLDKKTISQAEYDTTTAQLNQASADVVAIKAQIAKKQVRAPFDGRVGIRMVNLGQFIARGAALMPLQKLNPIYVNFYIPQRQLPTLALGQKVGITVDAFPHQAFEATVTAINSEVDAATRNISVQATLPNPDESLRSGMFARVEVKMRETEAQVVIPATSISYASYGNSVFIVEKMKDHEGKEYLGVRQQFVKIGPARGDLVAILEGVKAGEQVVTSGVFKLRNAAPVQVNNTVVPTSEIAPKPSNT